MTTHFIAIGGAVMHNLALALRAEGDKVTGSDDEIFDPALTNLAKGGLLPDEMGWFPEKIHAGIDAVVLGMHAKADNPELLRAKELGLKVYSFPEYVYERSKDKKRIVIGGSHGKTSITAMIMHVLRYYDKPFDYLVGAKLDGFELMVQFSDAPIIILEGDEYLSSALDRRPKFHLYQPHVAVLSGIAWDHINVFPTFDNYVEQFRHFVDTIEQGGHLIYYNGDEELQQIGENAPAHLQLHTYDTPAHEIVDNTTYLETEAGKVALQVFGAHNLQNLEAARNVCAQLDIPAKDFYTAISTFAGAARRLEKLGENSSTVIYKDFAHSPSKLKATINAFKSQYTDRRLVAVMELHTYSSLNKSFLEQYDGCMDMADIPVVYFDHHALAIKRLDDLDPEEVRKAFNNDKVQVFTDKDELEAFLRSVDFHHINLLLMSSGNFGGIDVDGLVKVILGKVSNHPYNSGR